MGDAVRNTHGGRGPGEEAIVAKIVVAAASRILRKLEGMVKGAEDEYAPTTLASRAARPSRGLDQSALSRNSQGYFVGARKIGAAQYRSPPSGFERQPDETGRVTLCIVVDAPLSLGAMGRPVPMG
ncbi:hypothetical protein [Methylorubrum extorquens]|uniref:hypothetical protein n=1 Tax=Methylorubrum extorquens TaxID=408 RepID=UPI0012DB6EB7|nr:hypothetical protein [Methylorubrum extorquens]